MEGEQKEMKKRLHFNSLKFQIILLLIIVILGIILAGGYSFLAVIHSNQVKYNEWCSQEIAAFENSYTQKYYKIQSIMSACGYNENMQRLLSGAEESSYEVLTPIDNMERSLILMMYNYTELDDALLDVYIQDRSNNLYTYTVYHNEEELFHFMEESSKSSEEHVSDVLDIGNFRCFAIAQPIRKFEDNGLEFALSDEEIIGTSIFTVKTDFMMDNLKKIKKGSSRVYLLDKWGNVMLEPEGQLMLEDKVAQEIQSRYQETGKIFSMEKAGYAINAKHIGNNGWTLAVVTPVWERNFYDVAALGWLMVWPALLLCIFFFAFPVIRSLNSFVYSMMVHMEKIGEGDLKAKLEPVDKKEFCQIAEGLNTMMDRINLLLEKNIYLSTQLYREEAEKTNAMLFALQSQMNPHFLYNTIECIKNIGICYDVKEIEQLSTALSGVLRYSLRQENIVPVEQEMECIRNFITIQTIRFEDKYEIIYETDESLLKYPILRLSLQPLVENAMKHGLEMKNGQCILYIRVYEDEKKLYLQVEDNGTGMSQEQVEEILSGKKCLSGSVAISNLINRLHLFYGEDAGLTIDSVLGRGTSMIICIGKKSMEKEKKSM